MASSHQSSDDLWRLAGRLFKLFVARTDVYGVEDERGWRTEKGELTRELVVKHLKGELTLGVLPFNAKGVCKWICADVDQPKGDYIYEMVVERFGEGSVLLERTGGKGSHVWVFLEPTPLWQIAPVLDELEKELWVRFFPKQRSIKAETVGNFVRLPLGLHHKTGQWSRIVKGDIWSVRPYCTCRYRTFDQFGEPICTYSEGAPAVCEPSNCPYVPIERPELKALKEGDALIEPKEERVSAEEVEALLKECFPVDYTNGFWAFGREEFIRAEECEVKPVRRRDGKEVPMLFLKGVVTTLYRKGKPVKEIRCAERFIWLTGVDEDCLRSDEWRELVRRLKMGF